MKLTHHASSRLHERRINPHQLEWLLAYGQMGYNKGVCLYYFDQESHTLLLQEIESQDHDLADRARDIFAVLADDVVVTVGHRDDRFKTQKSHRRVRRGLPANPAARRIHYRHH